MASSEEVVRQSITFRYNSVKSKVALMEARLKDVNALVKVKNPSLLLQIQKNTPASVASTMGGNRDCNRGGGAPHDTSNDSCSYRGA
jgi:hypothetical protein